MYKKKNSRRLLSYQTLEQRNMFSVEGAFCLASDVDAQRAIDPAIVLSEAAVASSPSADVTYGPIQATPEVHTTADKYEMPDSALAFVEPPSIAMTTDAHTSTPTIAADYSTPAILTQPSLDPFLPNEFADTLAAEGEGPGGGSSASGLTPDQQRALDLCGDDQECRANLTELFGIIANTPAPPWLSLETITFGGRCVWWTTHAHSDILDAERAGTDLGGISITEDWRHYIGPNPLWREHHYLTVTLPNGNVFYMDVYWLGGGDHIFFELPWSLVDDAEYSLFMERCTSAMDASMH